MYFYNMTAHYIPIILKYYRLFEKFSILLLHPPSKNQ